MRTVSVPLIAITPDEYLTICTTMGHDPIDNSLFILARRKDGAHFERTSEHGTGLCVFPDAVQLMLFIFTEMTKLGMKKEDWFPVPLRRAVSASDEEIRTLAGAFVPKPVTSSPMETGTAYVTQDSISASQSDAYCSCGECDCETEGPQLPPMGLFGKRKTGDS
jgi:hypothetical protein